MSGKREDDCTGKKRPGSESHASKPTLDPTWPKAGPILTDWVKRPKQNTHTSSGSRNTKEAESVVGPSHQTETTESVEQPESIAEPQTKAKPSERAERVEASGSKPRSSFKSSESDSRSGFSARRVEVNKLQDFMVTNAPGVGFSRILMLNPGQGGTFAFGDRFKDEHGKFVTPEESEAAQSKIKHLKCYDAKLIGTKDCVTCLGVYFEMEGNRIFCAHINAWHDAEDDAGDGLQKWTFEYADIRKHIWDALTTHSVEHGWTRDSVKMDTVVIVCPRPEETAFAVPDAVILDFLGFGEPQYPLNAHGFLAIPNGRTKDDNAQVQLLKVEYRDFNRETVSLYEDMPVELDEVHYVNTDYSFVKQQWTYTVGVGFHSR